MLRPLFSDLMVQQIIKRRKHNAYLKTEYSKIQRWSCQHMFRLESCARAPPIQKPQGMSEYDLARYEPYWQKVANDFSIDPSFINLENGYYGIMPDPIFREYQYQTRKLNLENSYFLRTEYKENLEKIRIRLAKILGAKTNEIAITRGGTEALQNLITGYNRLKSSDAILYSNLDYYSCRYAMEWLNKRHQVDILELKIPEPANSQNILDTYEQAFQSNPHIKLVLLTHMNNRTGLVLPIKKIIELANHYEVEAIVDAAHSWGQIDFKVGDLDADYIGFSLHKWIHAPLGLGALFIRKSKLNHIDPFFADKLYPEDDVRSRVHSGTKNVAAFMTIDRALDYHLCLSAAAKEHRLRYLRDRWVEASSDLRELEILTPNDPSLNGGITSFRVAGCTSYAENKDIANYLKQAHNIFTVARKGPINGACIRVTPALFTLPEQVDRLSSALPQVIKKFKHT